MSRPAIDESKSVLQSEPSFDDSEEAIDLMKEQEWRADVMDDERYPIEEERELIESELKVIQEKISLIADIENNSCKEIELTGDHSFSSLNVEFRSQEGKKLLQSLAESLKVTSSLRSLNLASSKIGAAGLKILMPGLIQNRSLRNLNIRNNYIDREGIKRLCSLLLVHPSLQSIDFSLNYIGNKMARELALVLRSNPRIRKLDLRNCYIGSIGAQVLAGELKTNNTLTNLLLSSNEIGLEGAKAFADCIRSNSSLEVLGLMHAGLKSKGVDTILEALAVNTSLRSVTLLANGSKYVNIGEPAEELNRRNQAISDAVADYAKTILGARLFQTLSLQTYEISEIDTENLTQKLCTIARKHLFSTLEPAQIVAFSNHWHDGLRQTVTQRLKDYNGIKWPSLLHDENGVEIKELEIPFEIIEKRGWKLIIRTTPAELQKEGRNLQHCVGGYAGKCISGNSHIVSIVDESEVDEQGNVISKAVSTIEYIADYQNSKMTVAQHAGRGNSNPCSEAVAVCKWFDHRISEEGDIKIDYNYLRRAKEERCQEANSKSLKAKAAHYLGFNPLDSKKFREVIRTFEHTMLPHQIEGMAENFHDFLNIEEIDLEEVTINGQSKFHLPPVREVSLPKPVPVVSQDRSKSNIEKNSVQQEALLQEIQNQFDIILGKDAVAVSVIDISGGKTKFGQICLTPKVIGVFEKLNEIDILRGKVQENLDLQEGAQILLINLAPRPVREILSKIISQKSAKMLAQEVPPAIIENDQIIIEPLSQGKCCNLL